MECPQKCPVCLADISGWHYGILSCESCKGFFKRTVQGIRDSGKQRQYCTDRHVITATTRRICTACRFDKCLKVGMRIELVRKDKKRGGRSRTYPKWRKEKQTVRQQQAPVAPPVWNNPAVTVNVFNYPPPYPVFQNVPYFAPPYQIPFGPDPQFMEIKRETVEEYPQYEKFSDEQYYSEYDQNEQQPYYSN
ncbi:unnamed protein product [Caenorhabditis sp. 36 PRJEB53466]|nr:unnamed protein product [Caenorhabditis sp. 36 PRJEB53466]